LIWVDFVPHISKTARFTIGQRIENKFLDLLELAYSTYFSKKDGKYERVSECIFLLDTLKYLVSVAWEAKFIPNGKYEELSLKFSEIGRMLGGWQNNLDKDKKKNRLA
jgi:hypothetical protein